MVRRRNHQEWTTLRTAPLRQLIRSVTEKYGLSRPSPDRHHQPCQSRLEPKAATRPCFVSILGYGWPWAHCSVATRHVGVASPGTKVERLGLRVFGLGLETHVFRTCIFGFLENGIFTMVLLSATQRLHGLTHGRMATAHGWTAHGSNAWLGELAEQ